MTDVVRFGEPGGEAFPFLITGANSDECVIVYARSTVEAAQLFVSRAGGDGLFDIRLMADNE